MILISEPERTLIFIALGVWGVYTGLLGYTVTQQGRKIQELRYKRDRDRMQAEMMSGLITRIIQILERNRLK